MTVTTSIADLTSYINRAAAEGRTADEVAARGEAIANLGATGATNTTAGQAIVTAHQTAIVTAIVKGHRNS